MPNPTWQIYFVRATGSPYVETFVKFGGQYLSLVSDLKITIDQDTHRPVLHISTKAPGMDIQTLTRDEFDLMRSQENKQPSGITNEPCNTEKLEPKDIKND